MHTNNEHLFKQLIVASGLEEREFEILFEKLLQYDSLQRSETKADTEQTVLETYKGAIQWLYTMLDTDEWKKFASVKTVIAFLMIESQAHELLKAPHHNIR